MRLNFNVLWVDDQPRHIQPQIEAITRQMEEEGFEFKPTLCRSIDEVRAQIKPDVFTDEVDLILVDWDLGGGIEGQDAIAEIRQSVQYKDVVFYSARTPPEKLRELAYFAGLEGVYCAARDGLVDEVVGVFESLVKKVLDLDHARGIVMGATSDIDYMVSESLVLIHGKLDNAGKAAMLKEAFDHIDEQIDTITELADGLKRAPTMGTLLEAHMIFTANSRLRILSRALKTEAFKAHKGTRPAVIEYMDKVVPKRNDLAHKVLIPDSKPGTVTDNKGNTFTLDEMRDLRRLILNLRGQFRNFWDALRAGS